MLIIAMGLGWYLEYQHRHQREIVGSWTTHDPNSPFELDRNDYLSKLEIRADGTFTKIQSMKYTSFRFEGHYERSADHYYRFHITSKTEENALADEPAITMACRDEYMGRCALDAAGFLIFDMSMRVHHEPACGIDWETHAADLRLANCCLGAHA